MATNLELKVACMPEDLKLVRTLALESGVTGLADLRQIDTYFHTRSGRLKLREIANTANQRSCELIGYHRPDMPGSRWSDYSRADIDPGAAASVRQALEATLGVWLVVDKRRTVGIWKRTRIHLDDVDGLGCFVELETVTEDANDPTALLELQDIASRLGLDDRPAIAGSYSDLLATTNLTNVLDPEERNSR